MQEAFASRAPAVAIGWTIDDLAAAYPAYRRHWQAMERAVASAASAYMHSHAGHAVARASMQAPVIGLALGVGLKHCSISDVPRRLRPDHRFAVLQRHPVDWRAVYEALDADLAGDPRWAAVRDGERLRTAMFAVELRSLWTAVNDAAFAACAARLAEHGCATLGSEAHHLEIVDLLDAARLIVPDLDLHGSASGQDSTTMVVLGNVERETYVSGQPGPARLPPPSVRPADMVTGPVAEHLMLCVRRGTTVAANFDFGAGPAPRPGSAAVHLRRGEADEHGALRVILLDVERRRPDELLAVGVPVYAMFDISLFDAARRAHWGDLLDPHRTALLLDVPLADHLPLWLANPSSVLRYAFLRTEAHGRVVPILLADIETDGSRSHLLVRALSPPAVRVMRAAFEELAADGSAMTQDESIIERHEPMLGVVLAHLAIEERVFGLHPGA